MDVETKAPESVTDASHLEISSDELDSIADSSRPFVGNWQNLISQTNWEKGKIILQWRKELAQSGVDTRLYSDPAWSRLVGEVTPQHVGRLRRTWERFGDVQQDYEKLYWSHFFAALDWDDAEMWLEGAVQNKWSVSQMRFQRWETMGKLKEHEPKAEDVVTGSGEEGIESDVAPIASALDSGETEYQDGGSSEIQGPLREGPDFGEDENPNGESTAAVSRIDEMGDRVDIDSILQDITDDIADPFRSLRSAILEARNDDWTTVKRIDVIALINDLKMLLRKLPKPQETIESIQED